ncbi:MAG: DUF2950 domain-containing protein [SAR324 cluster bacterium]
MNPSLTAHPGQRLDRRRRRRATVLALPLLLTASMAFAAKPGQQTFASPEAGVAALVEAVHGDDPARLLAILGPGGEDLIHSGDEAVDREGRESFIRAYNEAHRIVLDGAAHATLEIGKDQWPFPIPVVKAAGGWFFDTQEGEQEILTRRIGRNELAAMQACRTIVTAERQFFAHSGTRDALSQYAAKFVSSAGQRDGLYWEGRPGEPSSPIDAPLAGAGIDSEPATRGAAHVPYHGYFYRILTAQGAGAPGGARNYVVNGKLTGGFAVLAFPVLYSVSGVMSFTAGPDGAVLEKDLGSDSAAVAARMTAFDPDASWKTVADPQISQIRQ